jgi:hypothetical protein
MPPLPSRATRAAAVAFIVCGAAALQAQEAPPADAGTHDHAAHSAPADATTASGWTLGVDGALFGTFNRQGGLRGETEFVSQNWVMAMASRRTGAGTLTFSGMLSAEPATTGTSGYSEIFQVGESYRGLQLTDRQHPHDLVMQLSAAWRLTLGQRAGVTIAGGPRGEATLGPVAFMHRPSSAANPSAPLSHHVFDSTHIATGVVLLGVDHGPWTLEGSWFRGREPDEHRYDMELDALDSWAARVWYRRGGWSLQASHGFLHQPEQLEPGNQRRTNGSVSWLRERGSSVTAFTAAIGRNERQFSTARAFLGELTQTWGRHTVFTRFEDLTVETEILLFPQIVHRPHAGELVDPVRQLTLGGLRHLGDVKGFPVGLGAGLVVYGVPPLLEFTHGPNPLSFQIFVRLQAPARHGRMWNMTMGQSMDGHRH